MAGRTCECKSDLTKFKYSLYSALVFFFVANPETFKLTSQLFGPWVAGPSGCPSAGGLVLHMLVFLGIIFMLMKIKS